MTIRLMDFIHEMVSLSQIMNLGQKRLAQKPKFSNLITQRNIYGLLRSGVQELGNGTASLN